MYMQLTLNNEDIILKVVDEGTLARSFIVKYDGFKFVKICIV